MGVRHFEAVEEIMHKEKVYNKNLGGNLLLNTGLTYDLMVECLEQSSRVKSPEETLVCVQSLATYATRFHPGRYADGKIENIAFNIGKDLRGKDFSDRLVQKSFRSGARRSGGRRKILHIATTVFAVGGHTRNLYKWILNDAKYSHSVILTQQNSIPVPLWLSEVVLKSGGGLFLIPDHLKMIEKSLYLRMLAQEGFDFIISHQHFYDVIPTVSFSINECPPVAMRYHSDQLFSLGSSVIDLGIHWREPVPSFNEQRRFVKNNLYLPHPLNTSIEKISRQQARARLNLTEQNIMLLSMGSCYKYKPYKEKNFFRTAKTILDLCPESVLFILGMTYKDYLKLGCGNKHPRIHFGGVSETPYAHQVAADIFLESFTFGSQSALLESVAEGAVPVLTYAPESPFLCVYDIALKGVINNADDEKDYINKVVSLIRSRQKRLELSEELTKRVAYIHQGDFWYQALREIYDFLEKATHAPHTIPPGYFSDGPLDQAVSNCSHVLEGEHFYETVAADNLCRYRWVSMLKLCLIWLRVLRFKMSPGGSRIIASLRFFKNLIRFRGARF